MKAGEKMLDINDIRKGVELLDKKDETLWNADGSPKLEAVQNIVGDEVTQAALTQAISPEPEQTQPAWVSIHDNSEEHRGEEDINETKLRRAAEASAIRDTLVPELHEMQIARDALDKDIARHRAAVNDLSKTIHDNTVHIS